MDSSRYNVGKTLLGYALACGLFGTYAGRVCPMLETLTLTEVYTHCGVVFTILFGTRHTISRTLKSFQTTSFALLDTILFLVAGVLLATYYNLNYQFTVDSNAKVVFGFCMFGFFTGLLLELDAKIDSVRWANASEPSLTHSSGERRSMVKQAITLVVLMFIALSVSLTMVGVKGVFWLEHNPAQLLEGSGKISVIKEFLYVALVLMSYGISIMHLWRKWMSLILESQEIALSKVTHGDVAQRLPIHNNDEIGAIATMTNSMLDALQQTQNEVTITRDVAIVSLSALAESRDNETGAHILRTQEYVKALAQQMAKQQKYAVKLTPDYIELLHKSAPLHDIGKVGVPDSVLLKPGKLTADEFETMKLHPVIGAKALSIAESQMGSSSFLHVAKEISLTHHEKWDGSGYPYGLTGEEIPLSGRLMALADVYDALISKRVYKPAFSHQKALAIIVEGRGTHFDPDVVDSFLKIGAEFVEIARKFQDGHQQSAA
ncbi:HD domain-containing phosphohydrolase [Vibrio sp. qd031]|uniref:HD domain-containing phosphohydrolase n=1 Tax=Vibrio sp. qd031 TaxID=1603038 RepID=UPI00117E669A|nr:HD domain-containing phosphohydrolase [Vibrio sp. qd031]